MFLFVRIKFLGAQGLTRVWFLTVLLNWLILPSFAFFPVRSFRSFRSFCHFPRCLRGPVQFFKAKSILHFTRFLLYYLVGADAHFN